jgi:hypothetical protein
MLFKQVGIVMSLAVQTNPSCRWWGGLRGEAYRRRSHDLFLIIKSSPYCTAVRHTIGPISDSRFRFQNLLPSNSATDNPRTLEDAAAIAASIALNSNTGTRVVTRTSREIIKAGFPNGDPLDPP